MIFQFFNNKLKSINIDLPLVLGILGLLAIGMMVLYSASIHSNISVIQQLNELIIGIILVIVLAQINSNKYYRFAPHLFIFSLIMLVSVFVIGSYNNGARRWIQFLGITFQPSEIIKISVPLMLGWFLSEKKLPPTPTELLICGLIIFIPAALIAMQPDLGSAILIVLTGLFIIFLSGISYKIILSFFGGGLLLLPIFWMSIHNYQRQRILTFLNPESDPLNTGYHIIQSKIAIGSGALFGKGWLNGTQSHLNFLPERTTDFIFSVCAEEFGFIGVLILISFFCFIIYRGFSLALKADNTFMRLVASGFVFNFFISFFVNIGMVIGFLPVVGVPLPLVSYGGSSVLTIMATFGIIMGINGHKKLISS